MNAGSVSITTFVSTVVALVSVFVTVKDLSVDNERSLMVMFGDSSMLAEDDTGANEMRSCPLVGARLSRLCAYDHHVLLLTACH